MSKYTTEVRFVCEQAAGLKESAGYDKVDEVVEKARTKIFGDFPIFDEAYRPVLENKILKHYYVNEIGFETVGLWKLYLNNRMNEIMPYYNQLYKSELLDFNPFYDIDLTTKSDRDISGDEDTTNDSTRTDNLKSVTNTSSDGNTSQTTGGTTDSTDKNINRYSDTPQGGLDGIESDKYLTNATITDDTGNSMTSNTGDVKNNATGNRTYSSTDGYLEHVAGKTGGASYSSRLKEYRETFLNIDMLIIDELSDLFMNLW